MFKLFDRSHALTKTSDADAPERKGNRSRNRAEPFCVVVDGVGGFIIMSDGENGDSGDLKSVSLAAE